MLSVYFRFSLTNFGVANLKAKGVLQTANLQS